MGSKVTEAHFSLAVDDCFAMLLRGGAAVPGWKVLEADRGNQRIKWKQTYLTVLAGGAVVSAHLRPDSGGTTVRFEVYHPGQFLDPFSLYDLTLGKLLRHLDPPAAAPERAVQPRQCIGAVGIELMPEVERVRAASERVDVPEGISIKIQRSRTVEHTIELGIAVGATARLDAGMEALIKAAVSGEIERRQGAAYKTTETVSYEVSLTGNSHKHYNLVWIDTWKTGRITGVAALSGEPLLFRYREGSELKIEPDGPG